MVIYTHTEDPLYLWVWHLGIQPNQWQIDQGHKELVGGVAILSASSAEGAEEGRGMKQSSFALTNAAVRRKEIGCSRFQSQHLLRGSSLFVLSFMPSAVRRMELVGRLAVWG